MQFKIPSPKTKTPRFRPSFSTHLRFCFISTINQMVGFWSQRKFSAEENLLGTYVSDGKTHFFMTDHERSSPSYCGLVYPRQWNCSGGLYAFFLVPCIFLYSFVIFNIFGVRKYFREDEQNTIWAIISGVLFNFFWVMAVISWLRTVYTSPGFVVKANGNNNNKSFWENMWFDPHDLPTKKDSKNSNNSNNNNNNNNNNNKNDDDNKNDEPYTPTPEERRGETPLLTSSPSSSTDFITPPSSPAYAYTPPSSPGYPFTPPASPSDLFTPHRGMSPSPSIPYLFCEKCQCRRPQRAHHCRVCNRCVLRMDHHCPWVNNCIGFYNYKFFFLFVFYTFALSLLAFFSILFVFTANHAWTPVEPFLLSVFILACVIVLFLTALCSHHCCVTIPNNITTVEFVKRRRKQRKGEIEGGFWQLADHPYNLRWKKNLQEMLGPSFFLALCPLSTYPPDWDGWSFPEQTQLRDGGGMFDEREGPGREVGKRRGRGREIEVDIDDDDDYSD